MRGFTLLELMVTCAVVAILAAIALPSFTGQTRKTAAAAEVAPMFSDIRNRLEQYAQENGAYPAGPGETSWNPASTPGTKQPVDLAAPAWLPLKLRLSGNDQVACRYTFATSGIGPDATAFGFTAPATNWYYLLAKCDVGTYFTSSIDTAIRLR